MYSSNITLFKIRPRKLIPRDNGFVVVNVIGFFHDMLKIIKSLKSIEWLLPFIPVGVLLLVNIIFQITGKKNFRSNFNEETY